jgi:hypothetical protein
MLISQRSMALRATWLVTGYRVWRGAAQQPGKKQPTKAWLASSLRQAHIAADNRDYHVLL